MIPFVISDEEAQFFHDNGYLIVRGVLQGEELRKMQLAMGELTEYGRSQVRDDPDYSYGIGHKTGEKVLRRIDYVQDKREPARVLLANPFILRSTEKLMGSDLIPTWDAMVLKLPGEGIIVPWHRDAATGSVGDKPIFNVDFYLDEADEATCVWVIPGSHKWSMEQAKEEIAKRNEPFTTEGAVPALMQPGDVLFHNILVLHGSPANTSDNLRRVVYYEFRPAHVEEKLGPHVPAYIPLKQKVLLACIEKRKQADYIPKDEVPFHYAPPAPYDTVALSPGEEPPTYRYLHSDYWRPTAWTPEQMLKVKGVGQVRPSADGSRVAFTVTEPVMTDEKSEYLTQIYLANADGSDVFQATFAEKSSGNPQWSPDGKWLAFTSNRNEKSNLYVMRANGGEAERLTDAKADIGAFSWSPDSRFLAFVMPDPKTEAEEKDDKAKNDSRWIDENIKQGHIYLLPLTKDLAGKREPRKLTTGDFHVSGGLDWSPDGKTIVFSHAKTPKADDWTTADVSVVDAATGDIRPLVASSACASQPFYSPDGKWVALTLSDDPPRWGGASLIHIVPAEGGEPRPLSATFNGSPSLLGWSADGQSLYFFEFRGTVSRLYAIQVETGEITEIERGSGVAYDISLSRDRKTFGFAMQQTDKPGEAYIAKAESFTSVQVSQVNADLPELPLGKTEVIRWKSTDGLEIEGLLTYPVGYESGKRVPLLLDIHGGPAGVYVQTFTGNPSLYSTGAFAAKGYAILRCNPRGSGGYGKKFRYANYKDWGGGDYRDLMSGVDHVIAMGVADPDRMGVMGWSYGGFMTSWVITQTKRFKAASIGAAVTNLVSFTGTADIPSFLPDYFGAQFWDDLETYRAHSPMFNIKNVSTPSLIQHCEGDLRVPISQGYEIYNALKQQNVPTRMLVMPRQDHGPREPKMLLKVMQTNIEWFEKYVKGEG